MKKALSEPELIAVVKAQFGLEGLVEVLDGYEDQNYRLQTKEKTTFILKVSSQSPEQSTLAGQIHLLEFLSHSSQQNCFPKYVPALNGEFFVALRNGDKTSYLRLLTYLPGDLWVTKTHHSFEQLKLLGQILGKMDAELTAFHHSSLFRISDWDLKYVLEVRPKLVAIHSHERQRIAAYFLQVFENEVLPKLSTLRMSAIHGDVNDYNILIDGETIVGLIDFGDAVHSYTIFELAIACAYTMLSVPHPLAAAVALVQGYHTKNPLSELEISLLYPLIAARLCMSAVNAAYQLTLPRANAYHQVTAEPAWELLVKLIALNPLKAHHELRIACGFSGIIDPTENYHVLKTNRAQYVNKNLSISYREPLKMVRGALQYLYDDKGNTFVDCVNNVCHVGHCHPTVVQAAQKQIALLNTNTRYLHDSIVDYSKKLVATLPGDLSVCFFTNSGSEANDLAIRMSRFITQQKDVIVLDYAYHGNSSLTMELSPYKFKSIFGTGKAECIHVAKNPDTYRGEFRKEDPRAGEKYAEDVTRILLQLKSDGNGIAAFICESLLGVGGQIPLPKNYLRDVYHSVRAAGGICIADEVQVGFGRVGEAFWGFELQGVVPDMVVLGKPMGNGHPLAAVITTPAIAEAFHNGLEYFNTFGGNPVSMEIGKAVLGVIQNEGLQQHANAVGTMLMQGLKALMPKHSLIGDVRGHGLFIGIEMVKNKITLEPAHPEIDTVVEKMKQRGFLLSTDGPYETVLKIKPPLVFSETNALDFIRNFDEILNEITSHTI